MIETKKQAQAEAARRWGRDGIAQDNGPRFHDGTPRPSASERAAMLAELAALHAQGRPPRPDIATFGDERPLREWREAVTTHAKADASHRNRAQRLSSMLRARRYEVGHSVRGFGAFHVCGTGDTWDEAFMAAEW